MKSGSLYHLTTPLTVEQIDALSEIPAWSEDAANVQLAHIGLLSDSFGKVGNDAVTLSFRRSEKKAPASAVSRAKTRISAEAKDQAWDKERKRNVLEAETQALAMQTPASHADIELIVSPELIIVGSRSAKRCEEILSQIREHLGDLKALPYSANDQLVTVARQLVSADGLSLDNVELGDKITAEDEEGGRIVLNGRHYTDALLEELRNAHSVKNAKVIWGDIEAVINDDWTFSQINTPLELVHGETEYEQPKLRRAAELFYLHANLPRMLKDIAAHAGGLSHEANLDA